MPSRAPRRAQVRLVERAADWTPTASPWGAASIGLDVTEHRISEEALRESETRRRRVLGMVLRAEDAERSRIAVELHDDTVQVLTATLVSLDRLAAMARREDGRGGCARGRAGAGDRVRGDGADAAADVRAAAAAARGAGAAGRRRRAARRGGRRGRARGLAGRAGDAVTRRRRGHGLPSRPRGRAERAQARRRPPGLGAAGRAGRCRCGAPWPTTGVASTRRACASGRGAYLHVGLDAVTERLWLAGGEFSIDAAPGRGTEVSFAVPISRAEAGSGSYRSA